MGAAGGAALGTIIGGPAGGYIGGFLGEMLGGLIGASFGETEETADSRRKEADIDRRGDVQTISILLNFEQSNSFSAGLSEPQNRAALRGQTSDILTTLRDVLPLERPKTRGR